jgi:transmembrane sensor
MSRWTNWLRRPSTASQYYARVRSGSISTREDKAIVSWLEEGAQNERQFDNQELAWGLALELRDRPEMSRVIEEALREERGAQGRQRWSGPWLIAGACAALLAGVAAVSFIYWNRMSTAEFATNVGQTRVIHLEDGSTVTLNTATQLKVRFARHSRGIELIRGEALFSVHPDAARPFVVLALGDVTTAVGTEFAVEVRQTSAAVSVLEGTVTVLPLVPSIHAVPARVGAGQGVDYAPGGTPGPIHEVETDRIRAWQTNRILFSDKRLASAIAEYNRYTTMPIVLEAPEFADRKVHGIFRIGDEEAFIGALERALPLRAKREAHFVTLVAR